MTDSSSIYSSANVIFSFFLIAEWHFLVQIYQLFIISFSVYVYLSCFQYLVNMAIALMNMDEQVSLWYDVEFFAYIPKNSIDMPLLDQFSAFECLANWIASGRRMEIDLYLLSMQNSELVKDTKVRPHTLKLVIGSKLYSLTRKRISLTEHQYHKN